MNQYHKIQTVYLRDPDNNYKTLLEGQFSKPEFEYLSDNDWVLTEKVDGTNIRVMYDQSDIQFGGKTDRAQLPSPLVNRLNERFLPQQDVFQTFTAPVCLYGEGYGPKIQKGGGNYRPDQDFVLFDVKVGDWWLKREDVEEVATMFNIDIVPIIVVCDLIQAVDIVKHGILSTWGNFPAEGVVARPKVELKARNGERIITKIKTNDFK